jgi:hypothetical protein
MHFEFLEALSEKWQPVSRPARIAWLAFYALFLFYAFTSKGPSLFIDLVFVPIHEGGHLLFRWFGETLHILGGTILQLFVPLAIAIYFVFQRQVAGAAFAAFFFFENFLSVGTYMADARAQALQYVTVGEGEAEHDWTAMFIKVGLLEHDTAIGHTVRALGWLGMIGVVVWFWWRSKSRTPPAGENAPWRGPHPSG